MKLKAYSLIEVVTAVFIISCLSIISLPVIKNTSKSINKFNKNFQMILYTQSAVEFCKSLTNDEINKNEMYNGLTIYFTNHEELLNSLKKIKIENYHNVSNSNKQYGVNINIKEDKGYKYVKCFEIQCAVWNIKDGFKNQIKVSNRITR